MDKPTGALLGYGAMVILAVAGLAWAMRAVSHDEAAWCRRVFAGLAAGRLYVQGDVNWERLKALGADVGEDYRALPNERERANFRRAFITRFASSFQGAKGRVQDFTGWRSQGRDDEGRLIVAVDYPAKQQTLLVTVSELGQRRVDALQWQ